MWPHEKLKILVPRTPPDPPLPPLTPPRGPGGPKMAKMHSLKSIDDNLCQKSHFWGVKKIDLFFHSECTSRQIQRPLMPIWLPQQWGASSCWGEAYQFIMSRTNLSSAFKTSNSAKHGSHQYDAHWFSTHCQPASQIPNDKNRFLRLTKKDDAGSDDRCVGVHLGGDGARLRTVSRARQLDRGRFILRPIYSDPS